MQAEYEFIILVIILGFVILEIIQLIINKTFDCIFGGINKTFEYIFGGIIFLISMWIISLILDYLGFTMLADFLDYIVSSPANCVEYLKAKIAG